MYGYTMAIFRFRTAVSFDILCDAYRHLPSSVGFRGNGLSFIRSLDLHTADPIYLGM